MKYDEAIKAFRTHYWLRAIAEADGNMKRAAEASGVNRTHMYQRLKKLGIRKPIQASKSRKIMKPGHVGPKNRRKQKFDYEL